MQPVNPRLQFVVAVAGVPQLGKCFIALVGQVVNTLPQPGFPMRNTGAGFLHRHTDLRSNRQRNATTVSGQTVRNPTDSPFNLTGFPHT
jgi:hypothetical protein